MRTGPGKPSSTARDPTDDDPARPRPGPDFLRAVADYVKASRRFSAAKQALLAQVDAFEDEVRAAAGTEADGDASGAAEADVADGLLAGSVPSAPDGPGGGPRFQPPPLGGLPPLRPWPSRAQGRGRGGRTRP